MFFISPFTLPTCPLGGHMVGKVVNACLGIFGDFLFLGPSGHKASNLTVLIPREQIQLQ